MSGEPRPRQRQSLALHTTMSATLRCLAATPAVHRCTPRRARCVVAAASTPNAAPLAAVAAAAALYLSAASPALALAPPSTDPARCDVSRLKDFAGVRASFSMEVSGGALPEAVLDLRDCNFGSKLSLKDAVFSGAILDGAQLPGAQLPHADFARASARRTNLAGASLVDANLFAVAFDGADLRGAVFTNAIMGNVSMGKDKESGAWAELGGADFEGALLSRSDARTVCLNPTIDDEGRAVLGCR